MKNMVSIILVLWITTLIGCGDSEEKGVQTEARTRGSDVGVIDMEEGPYAVGIQVVTLLGSKFKGKADCKAAINVITRCL